jgi:hypothetical protein
MPSAQAGGLPDVVQMDQRSQMEICTQRVIDVAAIAEVDGFSERRNLTSGQDISYSSGALSY